MIVTRKKRFPKAALKTAGAAIGLSLMVPFASAPALADARSESNEAYTAGFRMFEAGDFRAARIELMKALKADPNNALARLMQARVALELGAGVAAQTELERAVEAGIPADKVRHLRAHALMLQGERSQAMELLDPAEIEPQFATYAARLRGQIHYANRNTEAAEREFNRALALGPNDPVTVTEVARFMSTIGERPEAEKLVDRVLEQRPAYMKALVLKGDIVRNTQGFEQALPYFNRALEVDPNNIEALLERAATLGDLKREEQAREDLERVNDLVQDHPLALYLEAVLDTRAGNTDSARQLMVRTKGLLNDFAPALMLQGLLALDANNTAQAIDFFGKVVGRAPNSVVARQLYATAQLRGDDPAGAANTIKPVIDSGQADARSFAIYGSALARQGNMAEAQQYLERASDAAPGDATAIQTQLAMTQLLRGQTDLAENSVQSVLSQDGDSMQALMMLALIQMREQKFKHAYVTADKIVDAYAELPMGYNIRGGALLGLGERDKAKANFRYALHLKPDYTEARRNLAQLLVAEGDLRGAEAQFEQVVSTDKTDLRAMMSLADLARRDGDREEQLRWLRQAATADRSALAPRLELVNAYVAMSQTDNASNEAAALLRDYPQNPQALMTAARVYEATGRQAQLVPLFDRLVSAQPNSVMPRVLLARALVTNDRVDEGRNTLERALTITGENVVPAYIELIALEARQGRLDAARQWAERLRTQDPETNVGDIALARAYLLADQPQQALEPLQAARQKDFSLAAARAFADVHVAMNNVPQAIRVLQEYQKENSRDPGALASIAELQLGQKQYKQAIANYEALRKVRNGNDPTVLNNLAWAYSQVDDPRALPMAKLAYNAGSRIPSVADTYGWILLQQGDDDAQALALLKRAAASMPRNPDVRYHLAEAYRANGERAAAVKELRTALEVPEFESRPQAQRLLAELQGE